MLSLSLDEVDIERSWTVDETVSEVDNKEETVVLVDEEVEVVRGETPMVVMADGFSIDRQALVGRSR